MANLIYSYDTETKIVGAVSTLDSDITDLNNIWTHLEYDEAPFNSWQSDGGYMMYEDGDIIHYPPEEE